VLQRSCSALALTLLLGGMLLRGQTAEPDNNSGRVFKTTARIVVVDVVVTGKNHRPLTGLHQQDFQLMEDGHPQTIHYFEEHSGAQPIQVSVPDLPPNVFTNIPRVKLGDSVTVLVLDSLNTPLDDQRRVHAQVLKYLKRPQPGRRIAIFTLGKQLRLIQSFTDDPALLAAALNQGKKGAQASPLLQSTAETASTQETVGAMMEYAPEAAAAMQQFAAEQSSIRTDVRIKLTLAALQQLADYLAALPGRKNVAWFSGAFPVVIFPDPDGAQPFGAQSDNQEQVRKTDALLTSAQVAIYPVGAEGVTVDSLYSAGADSRLTTQSELSRPQGGAQERNSNHAAMDVIAKQTGGVAFYSSNSLTDALDRVAGHGSNYYTLTYTSTNPATDGKYRKIQVALDRSGYQVDYRRGYYADDRKSTQALAAKPGPGDDLLSPFLRPGWPESTQIPLTLRVTRSSAPPRTSSASTTSGPSGAGSAQGGDNPNLKGALTRYSVDLMIPARSLQFELGPDGHHHVRIEAGLMVYNRAGNPLNWILRQVNLNLDGSRYAIVQANGVNLYLQIDGPEDAVSLRGGVYDLNANLTGTLAIPLSAVTTNGTALAVP
jgi:VWFA-related protein